MPADLPPPHLVLCSVASESRLNLKLSKIQSFGIRCFPFYEADRDDELTAFATEPLYGDQRKVFSNYQLLKDPVCEPSGSTEVDV